MTKTNPHERRLYILVRTDTTSLNAGKAMAQVAHAANQLSELALRKEVVATSNTPAESVAWLADAYLEWCGEGDDYRGFGTTIVLASADLLNDYDYIIDEIRNRHFNYAAGLVIDPSYPILDGRVTHLVEFPTCAWVFGGVAELRPVLESFSLHP
jgi:hypothetical protein